MSLFNTIRSLFGFKAEVEKSQQPIDQLDDITSQLSDKKSELVKVQREFDEINSELTLKLKACDKLIEKGVKEGEFNKNVIQQRLDKITDEFLTNIQTLSKQVSELEQQKVQVEGDILAKAIDLTSRLTKAEQQEINDIIVTWKEIGLIKGQEIKSHTRAIVTALDEIVSQPSNENKKHIEKKKAKNDKIKKSHEPLAIELAGKGDVIYDSPVEGHYANAIVCKYIKGEKYILFLKRAADKAVEPGKWCLPGGHIDEGETIEQAAARELKEEANLDSTGGYVRGKAKCDDGKWAFYVEISPDSHSLALLDGESQNATWMCREEWIEADLIFDLKDHLVAMESRSVNIKDIPDIMNPDTLKKSEGDSDLEKGGFHPQKPHHKYVRREGSPGNYTYYYDSPDMKSKDGKTQREGLYSSNVAPLSGVRYEKVQDELDSIVDGAGWATDDYIMNFSEGLTKKEKYALMYQLAKKGILYNEGEIDEDEAIRGDIPKKGKMTTKDVDFIYGKFIKKAIDIDNPFYYDSEDDLIKGKRAEEGEERTWGGKKYKKQGGKWLPVGSGKKGGSEKVNVEDHFHEGYNYTNRKLKGYDVGKKSKEWSEHHEAGSRAAEEHHKRDLSDMPASAFEKYQEQLQSKKQSASTSKLSTKQLKEHVENTSTEQLKKVAQDKNHPHNDAAKRELERREGEGKQKQEQKLAPYEKRLNNLLKTHVGSYSVDKIESIEMTPKGNYFINMSDRGTVSLQGSSVPTEIIDELAQKYGFKIHE